MIKINKSLIYLALAIILWGLKSWPVLSPPYLLIGHPVVLYGFVLFAAGLILRVRASSAMQRFNRGFPSKKNILFWLILSTLILLLFPPDISRLYYPPAPIGNLVQSESVIGVPSGLIPANASCSYGCLINICVRWLPGHTLQ